MLEFIRRDNPVLSSDSDVCYPVKEIGFIGTFRYGNGYQVNTRFIDNPDRSGSPFGSVPSTHYDETRAAQCGFWAAASAYYLAFNSKSGRSIPSDDHPGRQCGRSYHKTPHDQQNRHPGSCFTPRILPLCYLNFNNLELLNEYKAYLRFFWRQPAASCRNGVSFAALPPEMFLLAVSRGAVPVCDL